VTGTVRNNPKLLVGHKVRKKGDEETFIIADAEIRLGSQDVHIYLTLVDTNGTISLSRITPDGSRFLMIPNDGCQCRMCKFLR